jgi:hypothetical protein
MSSLPPKIPSQGPSATSRTSKTAAKTQRNPSNAGSEATGKKNNPWTLEENVDAILYWQFKELREQSKKRSWTNAAEMLNRRHFLGKFSSGQVLRDRDENDFSCHFSRYLCARLTEDVKFQIKALRIITRRDPDNPGKAEIYTQALAARNLAKTTTSLFERVVENGDFRAPDNLERTSDADMHILLESKPAQ